MKTKNIRWRDVNTSIDVEIEISDDIRNEINVIVYPKYPNERTSLPCYLRYHERHFKYGFGYELLDIQGNTTGSGYDSKGYGTLLMNTAIQAIKWHAKHYTNVPESELLVFGTTSDVGDPKDQKQFCWSKRTSFYQCFNFNVAKPNTAITEIKSSLSELKFYGDDFFIDGEKTPRYINIDLFWLPDEEPVHTDEEMNLLREFNEDKYDLETLPSSKQMRFHMDRYGIQSDLIVNAFVLVIICLVFWGILNMSSWKAIICTIVIAVISIFLVKIILPQHIYKLMPAYKQYKALNLKRSNMLVEITGYIESFEENHNGFLWRVDKILKATNKNQKSPINPELAQLSKEKWLLISEDIYSDYFSWVKSAKNQLGI